MNMIKKGLAVAVILLFFGTSIVPSISTAIEDKSSIATINDGNLSGYVHDTNTNPIEGALVRVCFHGEYEEDYTDSTGYYHVTNIPICWCMKNCTALKEDYVKEWVYLSIGENTTYNFVLEQDDTIDPVDRPRLFSFDSYIDIDIDDSVLNGTIPPDYSVSVPVIISYWTDLPQHFLWFIPWRIRNLFLFHSFRHPLQTIHLEVNNIPDWANIYFSSPDIFTDIPYEGETFEFYTQLIISVREWAPSESYRLDLESFCKDVGRINGQDYRCSIEITPAYVPCLEINSPQFTITPQNQTTVIPLNISNCGNKRTRVYVSIEENPQGFQLTFIPDNILLEISETRQIFLKVIPSSYFIGDEIIPIEFTAKSYPYHPDSAVLVMAYYLVVRVVQ
jgi:hypothetical protein